MSGDPSPGFIRLLLACRLCGARTVLDVQRVPFERRHPGILLTRLPWRCVECGARDVEAIEATPLSTPS
jgi:hypothetical protein